MEKMQDTSSKTRDQGRAGRTPLAHLEARAFSALNQIAGPALQTGLLSPGLLPAGVIELETVGWRTGQPHRTPLLAGAIGELLLVSTVRGRRSHWVKNLLRNADIRYWSGGRVRPARATVFAPDEEQLSFNDVPPYLLPLAANLACLAPLSGCAFALLRPSTEGLRPIAKAGD